MQTDPRFDTYIANSQEFAKPILIHLRNLVHEACPDAIETIKWGFPHFVHNKKLLCAMSSFKKHCAFIIHNAGVLNDPEKLLEVNERTAMGHFGRIKAIDDLPSGDQIKLFVQAAATNILNSIANKADKLKNTNQKLNNSPKTIKELVVPQELTDRLALSEKANTTFKNFSYSDKKEYAEWIAEAKTASTQQKRLDQAIEWLEDGKPRNWKYMKPGK